MIGFDGFGQLLWACALELETKASDTAVHSPLKVDSGLAVSRYVWELQTQCFYKPANPAEIRQRSSRDQTEVRP